MKWTIVFIVEYNVICYRYASTLQLTEKVDIFSFGVVLLEALCGLQPVFKNTKTGKGDIHIVEWVMLPCHIRIYAIVRKLFCLYLSNV